MLPGLVVALVVARWHYDLALSVSPLVVLAVLLVGLTATGIGYAIASFVPPMITLLLTNLLLFGALMFSPVNFPSRAAARLAPGRPHGAADHRHGRGDARHVGP